jgi:hypothetical protein
MAENARLATDMDAERMKVAALQAEQLTRTRVNSSSSRRKLNSANANSTTLIPILRYRLSGLISKRHDAASMN